MSEEETCPVMADPGCFQSGEHSFDEIATCLYCYDAGVARSERERIIKLLKAEFGAWSEAVALIEGENK